jgi:enoyl-CoA hydratase/carnithine racemase
MSRVDGVVEIQVPAVLDPNYSEQFAQAFLDAARSTSARVILLRGADGVFCRGIQPPGSDAAETRQYLQNFAESLLALRYAAKPVIAVVDGPALGSGLGVAAAADVVIASEESMFGLPEALFGFVPAMIVPLLLERMRPKDCRMWMLTGHSRSASEALHAGLVDFVCQKNELDSHIARFVQQVSKTDKSAVPLVKRMTSRHDLERAVRDGVQATTAMLVNPTVSDAFRRFFEDGTLP